MIGDP
jgi:hypothetical protein